MSSERVRKQIIWLNCVKAVCLYLHSICEFAGKFGFADKFQHVYVLFVWADEGILVQVLFMRKDLHFRSVACWHEKPLHFWN